jgi:hypothetical protein
VRWRTVIFSQLMKGGQLTKMDMKVTDGVEPGSQNRRQPFAKREGCSNQDPGNQKQFGGAN